MMLDNSRVALAVYRAKHDRNESNRRRYFGGSVWCAFRKIVEAMTSESSDLHNTQAEISLKN